MSDGGPGERWSLLARSVVWYASCWLKCAKEVRTLDAGPSPSSQSNGSQWRFAARVTTGAASLKPGFSAGVSGGTQSVCRLSLPVLRPPGI